MANERRQLQVKQLVFENPDSIKNMRIEWKYNKETKQLFLKLNKSDMTHKGGFHNISEATKNYGEYYW
jgi:hypothetical protein